MAQNIVLVLTYERSEMLFECLGRIFSAEGVADLDVFVAVDNHPEQPTDPEILPIIAYYQAKHNNLRFTHRRPHGYYGSTYNAMLAYREAWNRRAPFTFVVEDDIMVAPDFFRWHLAVHQKEFLFASVASRCCRWAEMRAWTSPEDYVVSTVDYNPWGVCFPLDSIALINSHAHEKYFENQAGYLRQYLPNPRWGDTVTEHDGLIHRQMLAINGACAYPCVPRAFHTGWRGYHRQDGKRLEGTLAEKVAEFRQMINDPSFETHQDLHAVKGVGPWSTLQLVKRLA